MTQSVSVIGLGKLGGTMAACFAERGLNVIGTDVDINAVDRLNKGAAPTYEYGLKELVLKNLCRLRATIDPSDAIIQTDITFVVVPTPSLPTGKFDLHSLEECMNEIGKGLKLKRSYHVVVITSTVLPGTVRNRLIPILEKVSGMCCGMDFGVCYNPEFIALGSIIRDFLNPDFYLLGEYDRKSGDILESVHRAVSLNKAPVKRMSLENAELSKIALNSFVTMKVSFSNVLADFCESIPDGDVDIVSDAIGMDKRIGRHYLTGGLGFAGPCFPRDNLALSSLGNYLGLDTGLLVENHNYNARIPKRIVSKMAQTISISSRILVLGLAYKPRSTVLDWSQGIYICNELVELGYSVSAHDPLALNAARSILSPQVQLFEELTDGVRDSDVIALCTPDPVYSTISNELLTSGNKVRTIFDYWRLFSNRATIDNIDFVFRGRGNEGNRDCKLSRMYE